MGAGETSRAGDKDEDGSAESAALEPGLRHSQPQDGKHGRPQGPQVRVYQI